MCASGVPYTVLHPVFLIQNWEYMREPILGGMLPQPLDPDKPFQMVDANDIGVFAAMAFEQYLCANGWENAEAPPKG